ncbi:6398_t:CDS:1 [Ambispora gerdemannii]|uniref:6398_t:CDS:1 n=1 Tax=Ambispora gerdemannii TaxID=144530 RepID=A0A9N9AVT5_9GLOM|nr:6398_t:CDS:1 [Ambispora gerdemannii]
MTTTKTTPKLMINTNLMLPLYSDYHLNYTSSPTHSIYLSEVQQKQQQKRRRTHAQKHLRKPQAFDTYLKRDRSDSISSTSSFDTVSLVTSEDLHLNNNCYHNCKNNHIAISSLERPQSPINVSELIRRVSAVIRFPNLTDDSNSEIVSASCSSDNTDDEWDSEVDDDNENFMFMSSALRSRDLRRSNTFP